MSYPHMTGEDARWVFDGEVTGRRCIRWYGEPPKIVTLCGSTRFRNEFAKANARETLAGNLVISVGVFGHSGDLESSESGTRAPVKVELDELHKRKIDLADEVLVVCPGGYIGESTRSEIEYAEGHGIPVRFTHEED